MRLIDADALMKTLGITDMDCGKCAWYEQAWSRCRRGADFSDACFAIEHAPTIEERKTGRWIELDYTEAWEYKCDQCGRLSDFKDNFCPNCGADMRGRNNETIENTD